MESSHRALQSIPCSNKIALKQETDTRTRHYNSFVRKAQKREYTSDYAPHRGDMHRYAIVGMAWYRTVGS